jgi:hypothetical protein
MILDESNVNKEANDFGVGLAAGIPFLIYRHPTDDDIYLYYQDQFTIDDNELISDIVKEEMTFQEAYDEVLSMRKKYMEDETNFANTDESISTSGDAYHTIDINPDQQPNEDIPEAEVSNTVHYDRSMMLNKDNYYINTDGLSKEDLDACMNFRGRILDMASDWFGGEVRSDVVRNDLMNFFEEQHIRVDISEWLPKHDFNKEISILLLNALSYMDGVIISTQHKMLASPIIGVDLANGEENENVEEKE